MGYNAAKSSNKIIQFSSDGRNGTYTLTITKDWACIVVCPQATTVSVSGQSGSVTTETDGLIKRYTFRSVANTTKVTYTNSNSTGYVYVYVATPDN